MKKNTLGFTLIELLVVIAIVAMLAAYALSSYRQYVVESKRADAQAKILEVAGLYEKFYATRNTYPAGIVTLGLSSDFTSTEDYNITSATVDDLWVITATAIGAQQTDDVNCQTITFNQLGAKGPNDACWR